MALMLVTSLLMIIALSHQLTGIDCLQMVNLHVPKYASVGETVVLRCEYDLETEVLYVIKWYKDHSIFYQNVPTGSPAATTIEVDGVKVELNSSDEKVVTLKNIELSSAGKYRCEVYAGAPTFDIVAEEKDMKVKAGPVLPTGGPEITGALHKYEINDTVDVNCTASKSKPAALLLWRINGRQAPESLLQEYAVQIDSDQLETSILGLRFQLDANHFSRGTALSLWCVATIAPIAYHDAVFDATIIAGGNNDTWKTTQAE